MWYRVRPITVDSELLTTYHTYITTCNATLPFRHAVLCSVFLLPSLFCPAALRHKCMNHRQKIMAWVENIFELCVWLRCVGLRPRTDTSIPTICRFTQQQQERLFFLDEQDKGLRVTLVSLLPQPSNPAYLCRGGKSLHVRLVACICEFLFMVVWLSVCVCVFV